MGGPHVAVLGEFPPARKQKGARNTRAPCRAHRHHTLRGAGRNSSTRPSLGGTTGRPQRCQPAEPSAGSRGETRCGCCREAQGLGGQAAQPPAEYEASQKAAPVAGSGQVSLSPTSPELVQVGALPVSIGKIEGTGTAPTGTWSAAIQGRTQTEAANIDGALIKITPPADASTPVDVQLDYTKFRDLYGAEWASRLQLRQLPECFLTTPDVPACSVFKDVPSANDPVKQKVVATIDPTTAPVQGMRTMTGGAAGAVVLAASDSAAGAGGTYKATSLSTSGSWSAGSSSGGFSWTSPWQFLPLRRVPRLPSRSRTRPRPWTARRP